MHKMLQEMDKKALGDNSEPNIIKEELDLYYKSMVTKEQEKGYRYQAKPTGGHWTEHQNIDMCRQGDVEIIGDWRSKHSIEDLKKMVVDKGYSAVCVGSFGHAALKKFDYQLEASHCKPSQGYTNTIYILHKGASGAATP